MSTYICTNVVIDKVKIIHVDSIMQTTSLNLGGKASIFCVSSCKHKI